MPKKYVDKAVGDSFNAYKEKCLAQRIFLLKSSILTKNIADFVAIPQHDSFIVNGFCQLYPFIFIKSENLI